MTAELVLVRRAGALWGVPTAAVAGVERRPGGLAVRLVAGGELAAELVVGLARGVTVRGLPAPVRRRLPAGVAGLALWRAEPVAVVATGEAVG